jgi:hypothetical protein
MLRRKLLVILLALGLSVLGSGTAQAWELIKDKRGSGDVGLRTWTRNWNQVAFVVAHRGTRIEVTITVDCRDGYHFERTFSDGGRRFAHVIRGLGDNRRCDHIMRVVPNRTTVPLWLVVWARG